MNPNTNDAFAGERPITMKTEEPSTNDRVIKTFVWLEILCSLLFLALLAIMVYAMLAL